ncbi:MAG: S8 family serine peptidase [Rhodobacter sp.]|nr:S8 family serine peptidase [Rhodobacter sp.]MCA3547297.1 S8 family serine peptidase [Rhodobacter sp.]MCA3559009.1 S8 family serine peptidase [Rhodobacter sp.]
MKVAVLDGGIDLNNSEFAGKIDLANSKSYFSDPSVQDNDGHGTHVAGIVAAARDGVATHGVAFDSQLVIFNGIPGKFDAGGPSKDFYADSLRRAADAGARVMNHSWTLGSLVRDVSISDFADREELEAGLEFRFGPEIFAAFEKAKAANLLSVFAAGNKKQPDASFLGAIPVLMPEYTGYFLSVIAVNDANLPADFTSYCGIAKDHCLAAPGVNIEATRLGGSGSNNVTSLSGTSMAAPHVTGAAALLLSQWPELDSPTIANLLLDTATDLGAPGVDNIYGHGLLNVANAVKPAGALMVYDGTSVTGPATPLAETAIVTSGAMEGALTAALSSQEMIVGDRYNRGYAMAMDSLLVSGTQGPSASMIVETLNAATGLRTAGFGTGGRAFGVVRDDFRTWYGDARAVATTAGILDHSTLLEDGTTGQFGVSLGSGWDARMTATFSDEGAGRGDAFSVGLYGSGLIRASFGVGQMTERDQVLGTAFQGASGRDGRALTNFVTLGAGATLGGSLDIDLQAVFGQTDFSQGGLVAGGRNMASSGGRLSISQPVPGLSGGRIGFNVSMPIVVTEGTLTVDVPVQRAAAVNGVASAAVLRTREDIAFQNDVQPVDVGMSFTLPIDGSRDFGLQMDGGYRIVSGAESQPYVGIAFTRRF